MFATKMNSILKSASTTSASTSTSPRTGPDENNHSNKKKSVSRQQQKSTQRRSRQCYSCQLPCLRTDKSLIRALGQVYHYECFTCNECDALVANKFYALNTNRDSASFKIVCEEHYHAQVSGGGTVCRQCRCPMKTLNTSDEASDNTTSTNLQLCQQCQPSYKCPGCSQQSPDTGEACYEFENQVYCLLHFSDIKDIQCSGCQQAIVEEFVEHKLLPGKKWHPECYMVFKFWDVRLADTLHTEVGSTKLTILQLKAQQSAMERKVKRIWVDLSSFEESSASCISDMLLLVAAGAYLEGFRMASQFAMHLVVLYSALDDIQQQLKHHGKVLPCKKESKVVCRQVIRFFDLLAQSDEKKLNPSKDGGKGVTQELLSLVTSLAQNLKTLIRISLNGALRLERDRCSSKAILEFLNRLLELERKRVWVGGRYWFKEEPFPDLLESASKYSNTKKYQDVMWDRCHSCHETIEDDCYQCDSQFRWHPSCFVCSRCQSVFINLATVQFTSDSPSGSRILLCNQCSPSHIAGHLIHHSTAHAVFTHMTQLQNYLCILKLALSRLYLAMNFSVVSHTDKHSGLLNQQKHNNITLTSIATLPFMASDLHQNQPPPQRQQRPLRRRSVLGSINFGIIKRVKTADLDQGIDHHKMNGNTSSSTKTSVNEPENVYYHQNLTMEKSSSSSLPYNDITKALSTKLQPTPSTTTSETDKRGLFSVTRRSSTNTNQRIGSLRHSVSQKHTALELQQQQPRSNASARDEHFFGTISSNTSLRSSPHSVLRTPRNTSPVPTTIVKALSLYQHLLVLSPNQYLLASYIAAKSIYSLLPDLYSPDGWMRLVDLQKPTLWGKLKTRIKTSQAPPADQHPFPKVFGVPLSHLTANASHPDQHPKPQAIDLEKHIVTSNSNNSSPNGKRTQIATQEMITCFKSIHCKVPIFVQHCLLALLQRDLSAEGIFRKNGNIRELKRLEHIIDNFSDDNTMIIELLSKQNPVQLAALLKRYLYRLPEPILTYRLYPVFVAAVGLETEDLVKSALHLACCMLPKQNRDTMQVIFHFLHHVSSFKEINKMDIQNLARIMAPSVLHNRTPTTSAYHVHPEASSSTTSDINVIADRIPNKEINVVKKLIKYHDEFGKTPDEALPLVSDHQLVEWLTSVDSKHFLKYYALASEQVLSTLSHTPSRTHQISHSFAPTKSGTSGSSPDISGYT